MKYSDSPVLRKGWQRCLIFLLLYIVLQQPLIYFLPELFHETLNASKLLMFSAALLLSALLAVVLARSFIDRKSFISLGIYRTGWKKDGLSGLLLAVFLLCTGALVLYANKNIFWTDIQMPGGLLSTVFALLLVAFSEELVFRGYLLQNLMQSFNKWIALAISAGLFMVFHLNNPGMNVISVLNLFLGGMLMGLNYIYTRNLAFAFLFHFGWNIFQGPVLGFAVSGTTLPTLLTMQTKGNPLLTGAGFGFEGSLICTLVCLIAILLFGAYYEYVFNPKSHHSIQSDNKKVSFR